MIYLNDTLECSDFFKNLLPDYYEAGDLHDVIEEIEKGNIPNPSPTKKFSPFTLLFAYWAKDEAVIRIGDVTVNRVNGGYHLVDESDSLDALEDLRWHFLDNGIIPNGNYDRVTLKYNPLEKTLKLSSVSKSKRKSIKESVKKVIPQLI